MLRPAEFPADREAIDALQAGIWQAEGFSALSEEPRIDLERGPARPGLIATAGGAAVGYAHLRDTPSGTVIELAVAPGHRDAVTGDLVAAAVAEAGGGASPVRLWSGDRATGAAAAALGMRPGRIVVRMERPLPAAPPESAGEARIVPLRFGVDESAYLLVSNEAFAGHPDSGGWDLEVLAERAARDWFDPDGVFLAWERGRPVGLCWTKLHPEGLGELYSVAVRPDAAGRGLGRALALTGLAYLGEGRSARTGMVYAEEANPAAMALYRRLGFEAVRARREFLSG